MDGANYIKQIKSDEINKIINLIYDSKPENIKLNDSIEKKHIEVIEYVDSLKKPKIGFWKKKNINFNKK
jgi:hypothetical protein